MSDIFGGIMDSLRGAVSDAHSYFDTTIGNALAAGITGGSEKQNKPVGLDTGFYGHQSGETRYSPASDNKFSQARPEDFNTVELQWLRRIQRFAQMDRSGIMREGKPETQT